MSTTLVRKEDVQRKWYVLDAADKPLGRTAVIAANILRGTGHVLSMMRIAIISYLIVNIPVAYFLGFPLGWGVKGIFLAFFIGLFTAASLFFWEYRKAMRAVT